jgi:hypothetical protein
MRVLYSTATTGALTPTKSALLDLVVLKGVPVVALLCDSETPINVGTTRKPTVVKEGSFPRSRRRHVPRDGQLPAAAA